jgi:phenylacetate-CoA ligase
MDLRTALTRHVFRPVDQWREGKATDRILHGLEASERESPGAIARHQLTRLQALCAHAYDNVPFYRRRFEECGITPADIRSLDDLQRIPPLTKDDLRTSRADLVATNFAAHELHSAATGGSTGEWTPFVRDNRCLDRKKALELRFDRWAGWEVGERIAYVWTAVQDFSGRPTLKARLRNALVDRRLMVYAGHLNEAAMADVLGSLRAFRPALIRAFPNPLSTIAEFAKATGVQGVRPKGIITVGEPIMDHQRSLIEEVFGCEVFNCYVSRECGNMAAECQSHVGLHVNAESLIMEFVDGGKPVAPGEAGEILITDLENRGMPFIRYRIGDMGVPTAEPCPCGRTLPLMGVQAGRVSDFVVSPHDGTRVFGVTLCHYLIAEGPAVGQLQIVQESRDELLVRISKTVPGFETHFPRYREVLDRLFHGKMKIRFEVVDEIEHEKSGKYRFCINKVAS